MRECRTCDSVRGARLRHAPTAIYRAIFDESLSGGSMGPKWSSDAQLPILKANIELSMKRYAPIGDTSTCELSNTAPDRHQDSPSASASQDNAFNRSMNQRPAGPGGADAR